MPSHRIFQKAGDLISALIPPNTDASLYAGKLTNIYYRLLFDTCQVDIMPALGTHMPMTDEEITEIFGADILRTVSVHNWRNDVVKVGRVREIL